MIAKTNAIELLGKNLVRTEMLIVAMEKIKAYDQIYQMKQMNLQDYTAIKSIQDKELTQIEQSCGEHAMISLVTAFETFYKELIQQLLSEYPNYFVSRQTAYSDKVNELVQGNNLLTYGDIQSKLNLQNRFGYYEFLQTYSIVLLSDEEKEIVEYLYLCRNNYVHNAGRTDAKLKTKLLKIPLPFPNVVVSTEVKRLRTKLGKILHGSYKRVIDIVSARQA